MERIIHKVRALRNFDLGTYKPGTLHRRIRHRMSERGCESMVAYLKLLEREPREVDALVSSLLIRVTGFFRDPEVWRELEDRVVPALLARKRPHEELRVWSAGCATGEEALSIAMLLAEATDARFLAGDIKIFATDPDASAISGARRGIYASAQVEGLSAERRERWFSPVEGGLLVKPELRRSVVYGVANVVEDSPISHLNLLVCRNVFIYLGAEEQERVLRRFHKALRHEGILLLGKAELIRQASRLFEPVEKVHRLYRKGSPPKASDPARLSREILDSLSMPVISVTGPGATIAAWNEAAARAWGRREDDVVGKPLAALALSGVGAGLLERGRQVHAGKSVREVGRTVVERPGMLSRSFEVTIEPLGNGGDERLGVVWTFVDRDHAIADGPGMAELRETNAALASEWAKLVKVNEELAATNEELQTANEELQTVTEELQATNAGLETMTDALRVSHDELDVTNRELTARSEAPLISTAENGPSVGSQAGPEPGAPAIQALPSSDPSLASGSAPATSHELPPDELWQALLDGGPAGHSVLDQLESPSGAPAWTRPLLAWARVQQGRITEAAALLEPPPDDAGALAIWTFASARVAVMRGQRRVAVVGFAEAATFFERAQAPSPALLARVHQGRALLCLGRRREAWRLLDEAAAQARHAGLETVATLAAGSQEFDPLRRIWERRPDSVPEGSLEPFLRTLAVKALRHALAGSSPLAEALLAELDGQAMDIDFAVERLYGHIARAFLGREQGLPRAVDVALADAARTAAGGGIDAELFEALARMVRQSRVVTARGRVFRPYAGQDRDPEAVVLDGHAHELRDKSGTVSLKRRPVLRRLLYALAARPASVVSKEELAQAVWQRPYHPLMHDNPLKVNVLHLRELLSNTSLSVEFEGLGYKLVTPPRFVFVEAPTEDEGRGDAS